MIDEHEISTEQATDGKTDGTAYEQQTDLYKRRVEQQAEHEQTATIQAVSIKPSIAESERFIQFLNSRFNLGIQEDLLILIHETNPNIKGFFRSVLCSKIWNGKQSHENKPFKRQDTEQDTKPLNSIVLSSHTLQENPYETLTHETAHYYNFINGIQDTSKNGKYHNKKFKTQAEKMLLEVEKDKQRGFAYTTETTAFKEMLKDFMPSQNAFLIFQNTQEKEIKPKSRLLLFECSCESKIRTARNQDKPLKAVCSYCNTEFKEVLN